MAMAQIERKNADFEDFQRFQIKSRSFSRQFCGIYKARLASLKTKVLKRAKLKWSKFQPKIFKKAYVIKTIFIFYNLFFSFNSTTLFLGNEKILHIVDLTKDECKEVKCIIIGTLYKHQELKPSMLKELANELQAVPQPPRLNYCSSKDTLFLEDDVSRVKLVGNITSKALVTGLACAVLGHGLEDGSFWVSIQLKIYLIY